MAAFIKRDTIEFIPTGHTPNYSIDDYVILDTLEKIADAKAEILAIPAKYRKLDGDHVIEMDAAEKLIVDAAELETSKAAREIEVDSKTSVLISKGFTYDNHIFSLSRNAQFNWKDVKDNYNDLSYYPEDPIPVTAQDVPEYLLLKSNIDGFYKIGQSIVKGYVDAGRDLKKRIVAAESAEDLSAIIDERV